MAKITTRLPSCVTNLNPLPGLVDDPEMLDTYRVVLENILQIPTPSGGINENLNVVMMGMYSIKAQRQAYTMPEDHPFDLFRNCSVGDACYWSLAWKGLSTDGCRDVIRKMVSQNAIPQLLCVRESAHVWDAMEPWLDQLYRHAFGRHTVRRASYVPRPKLKAKAIIPIVPAPPPPMGTLISLEAFRNRKLAKPLEDD